MKFEEIGIAEDVLDRAAFGLDAEEQEGEKAEVEGTPTFFINGRRLNGTFDVATIAPLIAEELKH